jgi:hypothetical protein
VASLKQFGLVWYWLGISSVGAGVLRDHFVQFSNMAGHAAIYSLFLTGCLVCFCWGNLEGEEQPWFSDYDF